ncbi:deoxyribonuclease V [Acaryochloris sp. IP29b_bin.148]|uniref:deoxyribonuclease V n=1 Tax=Acaryochloris sp. IP29b_bin.148 TaxID=2969218 RepID=UPI002604A9FB|nr:deoxyribonuclease V [Acaryochloris sp. IP29b_bin.148]
MHVPQVEWPQTAQEAIQLQKQLCSQVIPTDDLNEVRFVAGVDVGFEDQGKITRAAIAVLTWPELKLHETTIARQPTTFPYIPGLLSFREIPTVLAALAQIQTTPDLLLCDGQGLAHPRRFGIACHLGVLVDLPAIGVAKSRLVGKHDPVDQTRGSWQPLIDKEEQIGAVLRTRSQTKPLYISLGHRISLDSAIEYVMSCTTRYRLPETTRWADKLASSKIPPNPEQRS